MRIRKLFPVLSLLLLAGTSVFANEVVTDSLGTVASSAKSVEAMLQGQVAGVRVWSMNSNPLEASGISIRGVNSLRGSGMPLIVVDGSILNVSNSRNMDPLWQYDEKAYATPLSQLAFLTPNDIESIEVLKNTSATALYGSKGANGVILINTKRVAEDRSTIVWDSNVDMSVPYLSGYSRPTVSHNHMIMVGSTKDRTGYTLSAFLRDDNYLLPQNGSLRGGLRTSFETKANSVVWFGINSSMAVASNSSAAATSWYGSESMTLNMRKGTDINGWAKDYDDKALEFRTVNSMWLKLNLFKAFSFKFDLGTDYQYAARSFWWGVNTPVGKVTSENRYGGVASMLRTSAFSYNASGIFNYQFYLANEHRFDISAGAQVIGNWDVYNTLNGNDFYSHSLRSKSLNIAASKANLHKYDCKYFALGVFGNISYDWSGKVGADLAYRTDYTPEYALWKMYPSVSAYWDIVKTFDMRSEVLSTIKLDGGYGESGREEAVPYDFLGAYTAGSYPEVDSAISYYYDGRSYLHTKEWNVSLSLGFMQDRLTLEAGYYDRKTSDILDFYCSGQPMSETSIYWDACERNMISTQESVVANKGVEISIGGVPVRTNDWNWSINLNAAYNINRVARLSSYDEGGKSIGWDIIATRNIEGYPVSSIVDAKGNVLGNPTPKYHGSIGTVLRWKDLSLDIMADGAAGFNILNLNAMSVSNRVNVKERYVEKGDFLRLARITLGYDIPVRKVKWIKSLNVHAVARNLAVLTGYSGWSPDVNSFAMNNFYLGMDHGSYQMARTYLLGLSIKF